MSDNFFDIYTRRDNKLLSIISFDHLNKLKAYSNSSDIEILYKQLSIAYAVFLNNNVSWIASDYSLKFVEKKLIGCLEDMSISRIYDWNKQILKIYSKKSKEYNTIFQDGLTPFIKGHRKNKIESIQILIKRLKPSAKTKLVRKDINKFYRQIINYIKIIEVKSCETAALYELLEKSRAELSVYLFKNFNLLIEKHANEPEIVQTFFDFSVIPEEYKFSIKSILANLPKDHKNKDYNILLN